MGHEQSTYQLTFKPKLSPRIEKLREKAICAPIAYAEKAIIYTKTYKELEGYPEIIKRAKALARLLDEMEIYILDGELIVGNNAPSPRGSNFHPEYHSLWLMREIDDPVKAPDKRTSDRHYISDEVRKTLKEEVIPYWADKTIEARVQKILDKNQINVTFPSLSICPNIPPACEINLRNGMGHINVNYSKILTLGAKGIIEKAKELREKLDLTKVENLRKKLFYDAVIIVYEAMIRWAKRYRDLALKMAESEMNMKRRQELEEIAKICDWVPENPPRTFHEALQTFWFTQLVLFGLEQDDTAVSPGRFDQYMYPFYKRDIEKGILNKEQALELLECLFIKFAQMGKMWDYATATYFGGFSLTQNIIVGGLTKDGKDATNELSYLLLEAEKQIGLIQPEFSVRIHKNTPEDFLIKTAEVIRLGRGKPKIFVDETAIPMMLTMGFPLEDARDYCIVGCVEVSPSGKAVGYTNSAQFNVAKCLDLALNNGRDRLTGIQIGPETGDPRNFSSMEEIIEAFKTQLSFFVKNMVIGINTALQVHAEVAPLPFTSALVDGCLENGLDATWGGAKYNYIGVNAVGIPDTADSLIAIKKLIFEDKKITMKQLIDALEKDFEGEEELRQMLLNAPKYGNDIDEVDELARRIGQIWCKEVRKYSGPVGQPYVPGVFTVSAHIPLGLQVAALPSGRKAKDPLADGGLSPAHGAEKRTPIEVIKSVAKFDHVMASNGTLLNLRFSPTLVKGEAALHKFASFIRAYQQLGGFHVQFNVISSDVLKDAKKHPERYPSLLVRVAGYSAYFVELDPRVQDDIIERTEWETFGI
jgi:formate C-acetyltransferase